MRGFDGKWGTISYKLLSLPSTYIVWRDEERLSIRISPTNRERKLLNKMEMVILDNTTHHFMSTKGMTTIGEWTYVAQEAFAGMLEDWLRVEHSPDEWYSMMFDVVYALFILQHLGVYHSSINARNIVFQKTEETHTVYRVMEDSRPPLVFHVPTFGHRFALIDFHEAESIHLTNNTLSPKEIELMIHNNYDLRKFYRVLKRSPHLPDEVAGFISNTEGRVGDMWMMLSHRFDFLMPKEKEEENGKVLTFAAIY